MINIHQRFCRETVENGILKKFEPIYQKNFNFGYDVVDVIAKEEPSRRAMFWCDGNKEERSFIFQEISEYSNQVANFFLSLGIQRGDKVMLILKRHYEFWFALIALHKIGAIGIPATNQLTKKDIVYRLQAAHISTILCTVEGSIIEQVELAFEEIKTVRNRISVKGRRAGWIYFNEKYPIFPKSLIRQETLAIDPMLIYFTSGTTGMPKMVNHDFTYPIAHIITAKYWQNVQPEGLHLTISDTGWMKSMWGKLYGQWFMEAGIFVCDFDRFDAKTVLSLFSKYQITTFCAPPTIYRFLIQENLEDYDLSSLQYVTIAGEPLHPEVFLKFYRATGLKLMESFGQSETTPLLLNQVGTKPKPGYIGKASPLYDIALVDEDGNEVSFGEEGEIVVRVGNQKPIGLFSNYYSEVERTRSVWRDGLYHTGDTAFVDKDGYYWYIGRLDDIIKSSGYRIGPFEIESVLMEHPAVVECAVIGVPDDLRGQIIKAMIVISSSYNPTEELKEELQSFVKKQTAPYKYPRMIEFVKELPKTISGKIRRAKLRGDETEIS